MIGFKTLLNHQFTTISNLLLDYYHKIDMNEREILFYFQLLKYEQRGIDFPNMEDISKEMGLPLDVLYGLLEQLIKKGCIQIETIKNGKGQTEDRYDLTPVYDKINWCIESEEKQEVVKKEVNQIGELYQRFEREFGRPLSPMEIENIQLWVSQDNYAVDIIELALREAVLNQAYSFKYIDRILLSWERKNLRSKAAIQASQKKRAEEVGRQVTQENEEEELPHIPLYNWLENDH